MGPLEVEGGGIRPPPAPEARAAPAENKDAKTLTAPSSLGFIARPEHGMFLVQVSPASLWEAGDTPKEMSSFER